MSVTRSARWCRRGRVGDSRGSVERLVDLKRFQVVGDVLHGLGEGRLEVDVIAVGQGQDGPQAVSKFVGQGFIEVIAGSHASLTLDQLCQIADGLAMK